MEWWAEGELVERRGSLQHDQRHRLVLLQAIQDSRLWEPLRLQHRRLPVSWVHLLIVTFVRSINSHVMQFNYLMLNVFVIRQPASTTTAAATTTGSTNFGDCISLMSATYRSRVFSIVPKLSRLCAVMEDDREGHPPRFTLLTNANIGSVYHIIKPQVNWTGIP